MPARMIGMFYRDFFAGREVMVVPIEAFPPQAMPAMYGFYINKVYGFNVPVIDLVHMSDKERDKVLERHWSAFVYMPNCEEWKLMEISKRWKRKINILGNLGTTCMLTFQRPGSFEDTTQQDAPQKGPQP